MMSEKIPNTILRTLLYTYMTFRNTKYLIFVISVQRLGHAKMADEKRGMTFVNT